MQGDAEAAVLPEGDGVPLVTQQAAAEDPARRDHAHVGLAGVVVVAALEPRPLHLAGIEALDGLGACGLEAQGAE